MAQRVQALVHKLQQSQNDLSAQLAHLLAQQQLERTASKSRWHPSAMPSSPPTWPAASTPSTKWRSS
jgi:hypothetical protein